MPEMIRSYDEIMAEKRADAVFVKFRNPSGSRLRRSQENPDVSLILDWLKEHQVDYELAMPPGLLEGYSGFYALHFPTLEDPRYHRFLNAFETDDGNSLRPESYTIFIVSKEGWLKAGGPERLASSNDPDD